MSSAAFSNEPAVTAAILEAGGVDSLEELSAQLGGTPTRHFHEVAAVFARQHAGNPRRVTAAMCLKMFANTPLDGNLPEVWGEKLLAAYHHAVVMPAAEPAPAPKPAAAAAAAAAAAPKPAAAAPKPAVPAPVVAPEPTPKELARIEEKKRIRKARREKAARDAKSRKAAASRKAEADRKAAAAKKTEAAAKKAGAAAKKAEAAVAPKKTVAAEAAPPLNADRAADKWLSDVVAPKDGLPLEM